MLRWRSLRTPPRSWRSWVGLGLSPVAERNLGTFTAPDDEGDLYAG
jgi:hypothetical protein